MDKKYKSPKRIARTFVDSSGEDNTKVVVRVVRLVPVHIRPVGIRIAEVHQVAIGGGRTTQIFLPNAVYGSTCSLRLKFARFKLFCPIMCTLYQSILPVLAFGKQNHWGTRFMNRITLPICILARFGSNRAKPIQNLFLKFQHFHAGEDNTKVDARVARPAPDHMRPVGMRIAEVHQVATGGGRT